MARSSILWAVFGYGPVDTDTRNNYHGLYALDTFDVAERLSATAGARVNVANIAISDRLGASPDLNSNPTYTHLNPVSGLTYKLTPSLTGYFGYSQSNRARYRSSSPARTPMADANGNVHVVPGNQIPGIPLNQGKFGIYFTPIPQWTLGADMAVVGSRYFVGDDANQNPKLPGYWLVNLHASYQLTKEMQIFGLVNNLFNKRYALFGTFFNPQNVANVAPPILLTDHRTEVPGPPLAIYGGIRVTF